MSLKGGHRLRQLSDIPDDVVDRLSELSITTAEEFVSQSLADPKELRAFLDLEPVPFHSLVDSAAAVIDQPLLDEIKSYSPKVRAYGARSPYSPDFEQLRGDRETRK